MSLAGLAERWPSRLVATATEDRLSFRRRLRRPAIAELIAFTQYLFDSLHDWHLKILATAEDRLNISPKN